MEGADHGDTLIVIDVATHNKWGGCIDDISLLLGGLGLKSTFDIEPHGGAIVGGNQMGPDTRLDG